MRLLTPSGYKNIEDCAIGEQLIAYDISDGHLIINTLEGKEWIAVDEPLTFCKINGVWTLYENQSIWANLNVTHVSQLQVGDVVYNDDDNNTTIASIEDVTATGWWRLTVSGDHSYIADGLTLHNASRYWVGGGSSANWSATGNTNWGSTSGTQDNASVPTSVDDVFFDGAGVAGNTASVISANITIRGINISAGYTSTMTHNATLTLAGGVGAVWTYHGGYTIAGTGTVQITGAVTITSNATTWPNSISLATGTVTLVGDFTITGGTSVTNTVTINRTTAEVYKTNGLSQNNQTVQGTATIVLTGGTWNSGTFGAAVNNNLEFAGNVTVSGNVNKAAGTLTYTSGTITTTGSTFYIFGSCTLNTSSVVWNVVSMTTNTLTVTLTSSLLVTSLSIGSAVTINRTTAETVTSSNGLTAGGSLAGTAKIILTGGTWSGAGTVNNNFDIQGNVTVSGSVYYATNTLAYISGTVTTTGSGLNTMGACTLNTNGITWNNVGIATFSDYTVTLTSNLSMSGSLSWLAGTKVINRTTAETITCYGIAAAGSNVRVSGTAEIILKGGTWSGAGFTSNNHFRFDVTLDGNCTLSGTILWGGKTLKYLSGTITTTGSYLQLDGFGLPSTINASAVTFNDIGFTNNGNAVTLIGNLNIGGILYYGNGGNGSSFNKTTTETVNVTGGLTVNGANSGTAKIILTGGTWSHSASAYSLTNSLDLQGNITISTNVYYSSGTLSYISGTITTASSTLNINGTCTLNTAGIAWNNFRFNSSSTVTLSSNLTVNGLMTVATAGNFNWTTAETATVAGGLTMTNSLGGTAKLILTGGTWSGGGTLSNSTNLQGNITISGSVGYGTGTMTYVSGTITTTGTTVTIQANCTFNTNGMAWNNIYFPGSQVITLTSNLLCNGTISELNGYYVYPGINKTTSETITCYGLYVPNYYASFSSNTEIILKGGTLTAGATYAVQTTTLDGDVTVVGGLRFSNNNSIFRRISGNVNLQGCSIQQGSNINLKIDLQGALVGSVFLAATNGGPTVLQSDFVVNDVYGTGYYQWYVVNSTTNETFTIKNLLSLASSLYWVDGSAKIILDGATWSGSDNPVYNDMEFRNGVTISGTVQKAIRSIKYVSGKLNTSAGTLYFSDNTTVLDFHKTPIRNVLIAPGKTLTMNQFFSGSPSQIATIGSTTTSNYNIQFQDGFEKIAKYVSITNATVSRPNQLLMTTRQRWNTNRQTNALGIRYINQSPNGFAKNSFPIPDRSMTAPALGLVSDPNFVKQG